MVDRPGRGGPVSRIEIVPSILSADVGRLAEQVKEAEAAGADRIQVDVMDGHFVPNLTFGPLVVEAVRRATPLPIEAHLMIERPELFIEAFVKAGATLIEVQVESTTSLYRTVQSIKDLGAKAGVAINPATPLDDLREILPYIDLVNVMTVEPGFGGQKFIARSPEKISRLRAMDPRDRDRGGWRHRRQDRAAGRERWSDRAGGGQLGIRVQTRRCSRHEGDPPSP